MEVPVFHLGNDVFNHSTEMPSGYDAAFWIRKSDFNP